MGGWDGKELCKIANSKKFQTDRKKYSLHNFVEEKTSERASVKAHSKTNTYSIVERINDVEVVQAFLKNIYFQR